MSRQRAAQLRISPLHIQQGLFAVLALLITLIGGQQFQRWEQTSAAGSVARVDSASGSDPFQRRQQQPWLTSRQCE